MSDRPTPRRLAAMWLVICVTVLAAFVALGLATRAVSVPLLPRLGSAEWIIYPMEPSAGVQPTILELSTVFRRSFNLEKPPTHAQLRVTGFRRWTISINGIPVAIPAAASRNWKTPYACSVTPLLRSGTNQVDVVVFNSNGPPALCLELEGDDFKVATAENWETSCVGATWREAHLASKPLAPSPGNPLNDGPHPLAAIGATWKLQLLFFCIALIIAVASRHTKFPSDSKLLLPVFAGLWAALFVNNLGVLPAGDGFDADAHRDYIVYIQEHRSLPRANQGWEMFQAPLYYTISAGLLGALSLSATTPAGASALRLLGLAIGILHLVLVWASLRLLFPGQERPPRLGLLLASAVTPLLFISQYVTNEGLAACLVTASMYCCLRILDPRNWSLRQSCGLGAMLGLALLSKSTALLAIPPVAAALVLKCFTASRNATQSFPNPKHAIGGMLAKMGVLLLICLLLCSWHYGRLWRDYGSPLIGVWDARLGHPWWQHDGYRTIEYYFRFGASLFHPWFSSLNCFWDGFYTTLWGDGLVSGAGEFSNGPPWNYALMAAGYVLAAGPSLAILIGIIVQLGRWARHPSPQWLLILGLGFLLVLALIYNSLIVPNACSVKAFYVLSGLLPLCAAAAAGTEFVYARKRWLGTGLFVLFGIWALNSYASLWVVRSSPEAVLARVRQLTMMGRSLESPALLKEGLQKHPDNPRLRSALAVDLMAVGKSDAAAAQAALVLEVEPRNARMHDLLGMAFAQVRRVEPAVEQFQQAIEAAPGQDSAYRHLAALLLYLNEPVETERVSRRGLAINPYDAELHFSLGSALGVKSDWNEAVLHFRTACQLDPTSSRFRSRLNAALEHLSDASPH